MLITKDSNELHLHDGLQGDVQGKTHTYFFFLIKKNE